MKAILTTYLTKKGNPQKGSNFKPNDPNLMKLWYDSASKIKDIKLVIFHDELDEEFMNMYPSVEFVKVAYFRYSANDSRFEFFYNYLRHHQEIKEVFMTDLFDVKVNKLPEVPILRLFVSTEPRYQPGNTMAFWRRESAWCYNQFMRAYGQVNHILMGKNFYNPGAWGGNRDFVLKVLKLVIDELNKIQPSNKNVNMVVFNTILYTKVLQNNIVTGYPYHSKFKHFEMNSDACFIHK